MQVTREELINLKLSIDEAIWLKAFIQNFPGTYLNPNSEEDEISQGYRFDLFEALKGALTEFGG